MARVFGVRLIVILGFAFTVVLVQMIAVSRLGSYSQEFFKEEEQKLHVLSRKPTTSLEHVSVKRSPRKAASDMLVYSQEKPKQVTDIAVKDSDRHVLAKGEEEKERPAGRVPVAIMSDDKALGANDKQATQQVTSNEATTTQTTTAEQVTTTATPQKEVTTKATTIKIHTTKAPVFCDITNGDAVSAITRASTIACKNMLRNVTCLAQEGKLYNMDIPNLCTLGTNPGEVVESLSFSKDNNSSVRILFLMSLHGRSARQVKRLFKAIYHSNHYYYIHVDSVSYCRTLYCVYYCSVLQRSDYLYREMKHLLRYPNVALTPWQLATIWGGASLLQMLLRAIEDVDQRSDWKWDFFINLSESDYPIQ